MKLKASYIEGNITLASCLNTAITSARIQRIYSSFDACSVHIASLTTEERPVRDYNSLTF